MYVDKSLDKGKYEYNEGLSQVAVMCAGSPHSLEEAEAACSQTGERDRRHTLPVHTHSPLRQQHQSPSAEAKLEEEDCEGLRHSVGLLTFKFRVMSLRRKNGFILVVKDRQPFFRTSHQSWHRFHLRIQAVLLIPYRSAAPIRDICISDWRSQFPLSDWAPPSSTSTEIEIPQTQTRLRVNLGCRQNRFHRSLFWASLIA